MHGLYGTFQGSGITEIVIPDTVEEITSETFLGCKDLVKVELQGNPKWGDNEFAQCSSLELIELPYQRSLIRSVQTSARQSVAQVGKTVEDYLDDVNSLMELLERSSRLNEGLLRRYSRRAMGETRS